MKLPFAGIADRPYDNTLMAHLNWRDIRPQFVWFDTLWLTQPHLQIKGLFGEKYSTDPFPHSVRYEGNLYLEDGHHRVVLTALAKRRGTRARVFDWKLLDQESGR